MVTATTDGVTISSVCEPGKSVSLKPIGWAYFVAMLAEIDKEARKTRAVVYRKHIGDGYYVSITTGFLCVDLSRFILLYGRESDEEVHPTKSGIALRLDEW